MNLHYTIVSSLFCSRQEVLFDNVASVFIDNDGTVTAVSADGVSVLTFIGSR
jgi:hypothetical protein